MTDIIDWQGAVIAPYYSQLALPLASEEHPLVDSLLEDRPELAAEVDALHDDQKRLAQLAYCPALRQKLYEILMRDQDSMLADECTVLWALYRNGP